MQQKYPTYLFEDIAQTFLSYAPNQHQQLSLNSNLLTTHRNKAPYWQINKRQHLIFTYLYRK